jgi:short-subunit dehydrogenase
LPPWLLRSEMEAVTTLASKHVVITGAASGLGRLVASRLAQKGATVALLDLDESSLASAVGWIRESGGSARGYPCDVSEKGQVARVASQVTEEGGQVDIVVNNAGIVSGHWLLDLTDEQIERTFDVDALALFWVTRAFLPGMIERDTGHIVNVASAAGLIGTCEQTDYAASKHAAVGFDEALRMELRRQAPHVRTTLVCPYYIDTGMFAGVRTRFSWLLPILEEGRVADRIVRALERDQRRVVLPPIIRVVPVLREVLPPSVFDWLADALGVNDAMRQFVGHDHDHDRDRAGGGVGG